METFAFAAEDVKSVLSPSRAGLVGGSGDLGTSK